MRTVSVAVPSRLLRIVEETAERLLVQQASKKLGKWGWETLAFVTGDNRWDEAHAVMWEFQESLLAQMQRRHDACESLQRP